NSAVGLEVVDAGVEVGKGCRHAALDAVVKSPSAGRRIAGEAVDAAVSYDVSVELDAPLNVAVIARLLRPGSLQERVGLLRARGRCRVRRGGDGSAVVVAAVVGASAVIGLRLRSDVLLS